MPTGTSHAHATSHGGHGGTSPCSVAIALLRGFLRWGLDKGCTTAQNSAGNLAFHFRHVFLFAFVYLGVERSSLGLPEIGIPFVGGPYNKDNIFWGRV